MVTIQKLTFSSIEIPEINIKHIEIQAMEIEETKLEKQESGDKMSALIGEQSVVLSEFAKNLVEQMFAEALEVYKERDGRTVDQPSSSCSTKVDQSSISGECKAPKH